MRKRKHSTPENHERWLVSYADFVTLLFAFFVVMFASTQTDKLRAKAVSQAVRQALNGDAPKAAIILGGAAGEKGPGNAMLHGPGGEKTVKPPEQPKPAPHNDTLAASMKTLSAQLRHEIDEHAVELRLEQRGLVISLKQAAFFPSGGDTVDPGVYPILAKMAAVLNSLPNPLRLEGHTDSIPISTPRFKSNWELSAARSIAMLRVLHNNFGVARERMAIVGYADTAAVDSNETEEGRSRNRRVDIVILNDYGMQDEPQPFPAGTRAANSKN